MPTPLTNVFISHTSNESALAEALKGAISSDFLGFTDVFVSSDLESILVGDPWLDSVADALAKAHLLLVMCSEHSVTRPWINFEAGAAWGKKIPIVPLCHSGLSLKQLPMPLASLQGISLVDPRGLKRLYLRIARQLGSPFLPQRNFEELASKLSALQVIEPIATADAPVTPEIDPKAFLDDATLTRAINHANLGWTLCFIGEDQIRKVAQLTQDLTERVSETGNGKRFESGFSYWGIGPTLAWMRACTDPLYFVAQKSIETFPVHWRQCVDPALPFCHYVSLGVGDGQKDRTILRDLLDRNRHTYFFPVDMSAEMLRFGIGECRKNGDLLRSQILPIQIDFSTRDNANAIWGVVTSVAGDCPVLYSLLGNTLANFYDDVELFGVIAGLLRRQDKLLLEVATTNEVSPKAAERAAAEYRRSESFRSFATSALDYYTSLEIQKDGIDFLPSCKADSCVEIRTVYRNNSTGAVQMKVTTGTQIIIEPKETIRLYLTRKYLESRVRAMVDDAGCVVESISRSSVNKDGFGSIVLLLAPKAVA